MEKGFPDDAHDAGRWAVDWKKGFPADAHDAGRWAVDWNLMLMMLAAGRWIGKWVSS